MKNQEIARLFAEWATSSKSRGTIGAAGDPGEDRGEDPQGDRKSEAGKREAEG
jgi:hypothetical protein